MKVPLAGAEASGSSTETLLSEVGLVLLRFFDTQEACVLRLVCREFVEAVRMQQWEDRDTVITGSVAAWRACFPRARCANVLMGGYEGYRRAPVVDADFVHYEGLRELNMLNCSDVTDAAFVHLRGIHTLFMLSCNRPAISDAAFEHLAGIDTLVMEGCRQPTITGSGLAHLTGVRRLAMRSCAPQVVAAAQGLGLPARTANVKGFTAFSCDVGGELWSA
jgi:hypothetical protein